MGLVGSPGILGVRKYKTCCFSGVGSYRSVPTSRERLVVVTQVMFVEELAYVVRGITLVLEPYRKILAIQSLGCEFGIPAWSLVSHEIFFLFLFHFVSPFSVLPSSALRAAVHVPYGAWTSVTLVLWAALPVNRLTREGQHNDTVQ